MVKSLQPKSYMERLHLPPEWMDMLKACIGQDIELHMENREVLRGPLRRIAVIPGRTLDGKFAEKLSFYTKWIARYKNRKWEVIDRESNHPEGVDLCGVNLDFYIPCRETDGSIKFSFPFGYAIIYPKGENLELKGL